MQSDQPGPERGKQPSQLGGPARHAQVDDAVVQRLELLNELRLVQQRFKRHVRAVQHRLPASQRPADGSEARRSDSSRARRLRRTSMGLCGGAPPLLQNAMAPSGRFAGECAHCLAGMALACSQTRASVAARAAQSRYYNTTTTGHAERRLLHTAASIKKGPSRQSFVFEALEGPTLAARGAYAAASRRAR